jgi:hypothetical protein
MFKARGRRADSCRAHPAGGYTLTQKA